MNPRTSLLPILLSTMSILSYSIMSFAREEQEDQLITGDQFPAGFGVAPSSLSPDKRYGVLAPADWDHYQEDVQQNKLVEVKTGRVISRILAETGLIHMNHGGILPSRWSADGSFLLWHVDGKWSPRALVLFKIDNGEVKWQRNLLKMAQQEILTRTHKAAPGKYAAAKKRNAADGGEVYPDGFTINIAAAGEEGAPLSLPLAIHAELSSDPKAIEGFPENAKVNSEMEAIVDAEGKLVVKDFHLG